MCYEPDPVVEKVTQLAPTAAVMAATTAAVVFIPGAGEALLIYCAGHGGATIGTAFNPVVDELIIGEAQRAAWGKFDFRKLGQGSLELAGCP